MTDPAQSAPVPISIGDTVHLKSGGPAMTVAGFSVSPAPAALQCFWMTRDGVLQMHAFPEALLDVDTQAGDPSFNTAARLGNLQTRLDTLEGRVFTMQALNHPQGGMLSATTSHPSVSGDLQPQSFTGGNAGADVEPIPFGGVTTSESPTTPPPVTILTPAKFERT